MLNRRQLAVTMESSPMIFDVMRRTIGDIRNNLYPGVATDLTDDELRLYFTQTGVVRWMENHSKEENLFTKFMKTFGFDWGDVREMKDDVVNESREKRYATMIKDSRVANHEDTFTAMKLVNHWFDCASQEYGDCIEEYIYLNAVINLTFGVGDNSTISLLEDAARTAHQKMVIKQSVKISYITAIAGGLTGNRFLCSLTFALVIMNVLSLIAIGIHMRRIKQRAAKEFSS